MEVQPGWPCQATWASACSHHWRSNSAGGRLLAAPWRRLWFHQSTHSLVFSSTCSAARSHQGLEQQLPRPPAEARPVAGGWLVRDDRLGGLIHEYRWAA